MPLASGQCNCGKELDSDGHHLITCITGGGPVISHNKMVSAWSDCLSQLQLHHVRKPRGRHVNSENIKHSRIRFGIGGGGGEKGCLLNWTLL